jgi:hypothetical protein
MTEDEAERFIGNILALVELGEAINKRHNDLPFVRARLAEIEEHRESAKAILMSLEKTVV